MKSSMLLLKTLLLSTSRINIWKHSTDSKKRKKAVSSFIGMLILYILLMAYSILMCIGYGHYGIIASVPTMCALIISVLAFVFTLLRTNGYLFAFKEYDMLMSLPFEARTVAACKFLYMYVQNLPWYISISLAMMIGYGCYAKPSVLVYPLWIVLTVVLPIIPMLAAAFIGFLIAKISAGFRKTNLVQIILTMLFVLACLSLRFVIEDIFRNDKVKQTLQSVSDVTGDAGRFYLPVKWFTQAVTRFSPAGILLLIGVSVTLFAVLFYIIGNSYRNINSALKSHAAARNYRFAAQKKRSVLQAIAFKEFKRLTGSTPYLVNDAMGEILAAILGVLTLVIGFDKIVAFVTHDAPFDAAILQPAIPFIIYFFIGMMASTVCSPSLEGKNYWIIQSLPLEKKTVYQGKMLFHMYLSVPFMAFSTICVCISAKVPVFNTLLYLVLGFALCAFSTTWGCVCGLRHMRLDWENEIEVIKQGAAAAIYMFPNMFAAMGLCVLCVFLGKVMDYRLVALLFTVIASALTALCYRRVMILAKRT